MNKRQKEDDDPMIRLSFANITYLSVHVSAAVNPW